MGLSPLVTHSSGLRFGYESGNVSGVYSKSATSILNWENMRLKNNEPHRIQRGPTANQKQKKQSKFQTSVFKKKSEIG